MKIASKCVICVIFGFRMDVIPIGYNYKAEQTLIIIKIELNVWS